MKGIKRTLREKIAHLRLLAGDTDAFGYFYDQYSKKIYRFVYFKTSDTEIAQDITHDIFLQAWEYIMEHKSIDNFQAYLYRMARNKVIDYYRSKDRQTALLPEQPVSDSDQLRTKALAELYVLEKHLKSLKPEYQEVVLLKHVEGLTTEEISLVIEKDKNNVRVTLHRAMNKLKQLSQGDE